MQGKLICTRLLSRPWNHSSIFKMYDSKYLHGYAPDFSISLPSSVPLAVLLIYIPISIQGANHGGSCLPSLYPGCLPSLRRLKDAYDSSQSPLFRCWYANLVLFFCPVTIFVFSTAHIHHAWDTCNRYRRSAAAAKRAIIMSCASLSSSF